MPNMQIVRDRIDELNEQMRGIHRAAGDRPLTKAQQADWDKLDAELAECEQALRDDQAEQDRDRRRAEQRARWGGGLSVDVNDRGSDPAATPGTFVRTSDRQPATVQRGQRFADHPIVARSLAETAARDAATEGQYGDLGQLVRAMTTTGGSAIVPTSWAGSIIDKARNLSACLKAGAQVVPMDTKVVQIGRLTGDPTAAFRAEGSSITASDPTLDNVTLTAKSMNALVVGSMEWFADADNAGTIVENAIAQAMASQLDKVALYGGTNTGGVDLTAATNPAGIVANLTTNASSSILGAATNGTTQTAASFYNEILDVVYTPKDYNEEPNAVIWNSKAARMYAKAYDSTYQPLRRPADLDALQWFVSNQIPSYTQGTMTSVATDVFAGDFSQLLIGQRLAVSIQVLTERYADTGQLGIVATWRGDVGLARPRAFSVYKAIKGA
jgi:HK97 family phage major capsid protein